MSENPFGFDPFDNNKPITGPILVPPPEADTPDAKVDATKEQAVTKAAEVPREGESDGKPKEEESKQQIVGDVRTSPKVDAAVAGASAHRFFVVTHATALVGGKTVFIDDISFTVADGEIPEDVLALKSDVERTLSALHVLYLSDGDASGTKKISGKQRAKFDSAFSKLLGLAQVGLDATAAPKVAREALSSLQAEIVDREAGIIKNRYLVKLGSYAASFAAVALIARLAIALWPPTGAFVFLNTHANFFMIFAGCMVGTWLSFGTRKISLGFGDLIRLEDDQLEPWLRLIFTGLLTHLLALMIATGVLDITVGTFHALGFFTSASIAFLFGGLCGLSEKALPSAIMQRTSSILEGVGKK